MQREQLLHPSSIIEVISFLRILLLKMFRVFADVKSGGNFRHNLGPRYLKECLPYVTVLYLGIEKSECRKELEGDT